MKFGIAVLSISVSSFISSVVMADGEPQDSGLRSFAVKRWICESLDAELSQLGQKREACLAASFTVTKEYKDKVGGVLKTTRLNVDVSLSDNVYKVSVAKGAGVDMNGKVVLSKDWVSFKTLSKDIGDASIIERSHEGSKNVKLRSNSLGLPKAVAQWTGYEGQADYRVLSRRYFEILKETTVIGYIVVENACSDETEMCVASTAKFDLNGSMIGEVEEESRGINE